MAMILEALGLAKEAGQPLNVGTEDLAEATASKRCIEAHSRWFPAPPGITSNGPPTRIDGNDLSRGRRAHIVADGTSDGMEDTALGARTKCLLCPPSIKERVGLDPQIHRDTRQRLYVLFFALP